MSALRTWSPQTVFQEVPDHIALAFTVSGCPLRCAGCHSQDTWPLASGEPLTEQRFADYLDQYQDFINCVLFFGGEWHMDSLISKLAFAKSRGLKTCLYSGFDKIPNRLKAHLDFLKVGPWIAERGGLSSLTTNQRFYDLRTGECLNHRFNQPQSLVA